MTFILKSEALINGKMKTTLFEEFPWVKKLFH